MEGVQEQPEGSAAGSGRPKLATCIRVGVVEEGEERASEATRVPDDWG